MIVLILILLFAGAARSQETVDDLLAVCPPREEIAAIERDLALSFANDYTAPDLVCRASEGSADLTRMQERAYQAMRLMRYVRFDAPFPWTDKSLYEWFKGAVRGVFFDGSQWRSSCCSSGIVKLGMAARYETKSLKWFEPHGNGLHAMVTTLLHEARHADGNHPHPCTISPQGREVWSDNAIADLGSVGVEVFWQNWIAEHSIGEFFTAKYAAPHPPSMYRDGARNGAKWMRDNLFCEKGEGVALVLDEKAFGGWSVGVEGPVRTVAVTATGANPVSVSRVEITGDHAGDFGIISDNCTGATVELSCAVLVRFSPRTVGSRAATLEVTDNMPGSPHRLTLAGVGRDPEMRIEGVANAASYAPPNEVTPGGIVSIFGTDLAPMVAYAERIPLPTSLGGTSVTFDGILAPLFYVSPTQLNAQVPWEVVAGREVTVTVSVARPENIAVHASSTVAVACTRPAVFSTNYQGTGQGAVLIWGTGLVAAPVGWFPGSRPARRGEYLEVYCTGLGPVTNAPPSGEAADPTGRILSEVTAALFATLGGIPARISFAGLAPGFVGLYQANMEIPQGVPSGNTVPLIIEAGGVCQNTVTVAIE